MIPPNLLWLANHLWQSTLFAGIACVLALTLRANRAQIRYGLWLAASLKFLIPLSMLTIAGIHLTPHIARQIMQTAAPADIPHIVQRVTRPFVVTVPLAAVAASRSSFGSAIPKLLGILWAAGFAIVAAAWWRRWASDPRGIARGKTAAPADRNRSHVVT